MKNKYEIRGDVTAIFIKHKNETYETLISTNKLSIADAFPNTWYFRKFPNSDIVYAQGEIQMDNKKIRHSLHRWVTKAPKGYSVDHINNNGLINTDENLRIVTHAENHQNRKGAQKNNLSSGIRGVAWAINKNRWVAHIKIKGKRYHLGHYLDKDEAAKVAEKARSVMMPYSKEALDDNRIKLLLEDIYSFRSNPAREKTESNVRNVNYVRADDNWRVEFSRLRKRYVFGRFDTLEQAKEIADHIRHELFIGKSLEQIHKKITTRVI